MSKHLTACPNCGADLAGQLDGRAGWWSYRVRLYDMETAPHDPIADSDAGLAADLPGADRIRGLWKVLSEAATAAMDFHATTTLHGFSQDDQERKLRGIRPTLSRNRGRATIRVPYDTNASHTAAPGHTPRYLARIDILRLEGDAT